MADPLIGMSFSFAPAAPSRERDDAPRGGNGSQVLPVAELAEDFDGQPEDGSEYLFLVRREASLRSKITSVANPYETVQDVSSAVKKARTVPTSRPDDAWRESFVRNFTATRQRMLRAPLHALEPIDPASIPPPRDSSSWRILVNGKRAKASRPREPPSASPPRAAEVSAAAGESDMDVDQNPEAELAAMKAAAIASLGLDDDHPKTQAAVPTVNPAPEIATAVDEQAQMSAAPDESSAEPEYERLPRLPSPGIIASIPGPSIIHVLSHFDEWLNERLEAHELIVNYVPSTIFAPPSLRRKAGAKAKPAVAPASVAAAPPSSSNPPVGRPPLPTAHESHWLLSLLTRLEQVLDGDDLSTLRQLAKTLVKLIKASEKVTAGRTRPPSGRTMDARREDEEEAEGIARCWMIVAAIASVWSQGDLWDPTL